MQHALNEEFGGRIVLHFLPPYSPNHNRIERLWRELHANVTRNHRCRTLSELLRNVERFLRRYPRPGHEGLVDTHTHTASGLTKEYPTIFDCCCDHSESWGAI